MLVRIGPSVHVQGRAWNDQLWGQEVKVQGHTGAMIDLEDGLVEASFSTSLCQIGLLFKFKCKM